jgi:hypothetical protein
MLVGDSMERCSEQNGGCTHAPIESLSQEDYTRERINYKRMLNHAIDDIIDIESDDCCLRGFGTIPQRKFYRKKWQETYDAVMASGNYDSSFPSFNECMGFSDEEIEQMKRDVLMDARS